MLQESYQVVFVLAKVFLWEDGGFTLLDRLVHSGGAGIVHTVILKRVGPKADASVNKLWLIRRVGEVGLEDMD